MNARTILGIIAGMPGMIESVEKATKALRELSKRRSEGAAAKDTEDFQKLAKAIELQAKINEQLEGQFKIIQTVLDGIQKSIRLLSFVAFGAALLGAVALILAAMK